MIMFTKCYTEKIKNGSNFWRGSEIQIRKHVKNPDRFAKLFYCVISSGATHKPTLSLVQCNNLFYFILFIYFFLQEQSWL